MNAEEAAWERKAVWSYIWSINLAFLAILVFFAAMILPGIIGPQSTGHLNDPELASATPTQRWTAIGSWIGVPVSLILAGCSYALWKRGDEIPVRSRTT